MTNKKVNNIFIRTASQAKTHVFRIKYLVMLLCLAIQSCENDDNRIQKHELRFSLTKPTTDVQQDGRSESNNELKNIIISIKDMDGRNIEVQKEVSLHKFGDEYISSPIILQVNDQSRFRLCDFLVTDAAGSTVFATPRSGSPLAHLVQKPLDIYFDIASDVVTTISPEVVFTESHSADDFGYTQFTLNKTDVISTVFSVFRKGDLNFELTHAKLKIESLQAGRSIWVHEYDLIDKPNNILIRRGDSYRLTVTKEGFRPWDSELTIQAGQSFEVVLEQDVFVSTSLKLLTLDLLDKSSAGHNLNIIKMQDGGFLFATYSRKLVPGKNTEYNINLHRTNSDGDLLWMKELPSIGDDLAILSLTRFSDNDQYLMTGTIRLDNKYTGWTMNLDDFGNIVWHKLTGADIRVASANSLQNGGKFQVAGFTSAGVLQFGPGFIEELNADGSTENRSPLGFALYTDTKINPVPAGYFVTAQNTLSLNDLSGNDIWNSSILGKWINVFEIKNEYVTIRETNTYPFKYDLITIGSTGSVLKTIRIPLNNASNIEILDVAQTKRGYLIVGVKNPYNFEAWAAEIDFSGTILRERTFNARDFNHDPAELTNFIFTKAYNSKNDITLLGICLGTAGKRAFMYGKFSY